jgi:hypothetical protein
MWLQINEKLNILFFKVLGKLIDVFYIDHDGKNIICLVRNLGYQTWGTNILTRLATHLLAVRAAALVGKILWTFGHGCNILIICSVQDFVLLTWISKKVLKVVSICIKTCLAQVKEIFGHSLQLTYCNIVYYSPNFILRGLSSMEIVPIDFLL